MNLVPGDLYFIREVDVLDGATSAYCKIGLVKDSRTGDANKRADEHQTGNPRQLTVLDQVHAPAVSDLEASVHDRFATRRVLGEWFEMPGEAALAEAVDAARSLAVEQNEHLDALRKAEQLKSIESGTELVTATADAADWYRKATVAKATKNAVAKLRKQSEAVFKSALAAGEDVGLFASVTERNRPSFDKEKFAESNPDLFQQFLRTETKLTQRFTLKPIGSDVVTQLEDAVTDFFTRMEELVQCATANFDLLEDLHLAHLELLGHQAQSAWDLELAEANLKAACGSAPGIEGLLTWSRVLATTDKFDASGFKTAHPDLHEQFCEIVVVPSFAVRPMRSYRPKTV